MGREMPGGLRFSVICTLFVAACSVDGTMDKLGRRSAWRIDVG